MYGRADQFAFPRSFSALDTRNSTHEPHDSSLPIRMIRLALAASTAMLLAGLESLVADDGAHTIVERTTRLDALGEAFEGIELDVVVAVVEDPARFRPFMGDDDEGISRSVPMVLLVDTSAPPSPNEWLRRGVRAVLPRDAEPREIHAAIGAVAAGLVVIPATDLPSLVGQTTRSSARLSAPLNANTPPLSPREREILALMAEGLVNKIIAARLGISEHTVKTHIASIFQKLDAETRAEAVAIGARSGVILL